jgi:hypothetical protein
MDTYADQRGHDVTWMTAAERDAVDARTAATGTDKPYVMSISERDAVTITWWWQR